MHAGFFLARAGDTPSRRLRSRWLWAVVIRKGQWALLPLSTPLSPPRWLSYLLLFILDLLICLIACLGLAKRSRCLLAS